MIDDMETPPPILSQTPPPLPHSPPVNSFPRQAALVSFIAPFASFGIGIFGQAAVQGNRMASLILGCTTTFIILAGFGLGIIALFKMKKYGRKGVFGWAVAGVCINGFFILVMLLSIPMYARMAQHNKAAQEQQQIEQHH